MKILISKSIFKSKKTTGKLEITFQSETLVLVPAPYINNVKERYEQREFDVGITFLGFTVALQFDYNGL